MFEGFFSIRAAAAGLAFFFSLGLVACDDGNEVETSGAPATQAAPATDAEARPATQGNVIEVEMHAASFEPSTIEARTGDVIRFVNVQDVHNISWPAGQNPSGASLPATSPWMTAPGEVHDVEVTMGAGEYFFQCDPHVPMGMTGTLTVVE